MTLLTDLRTAGIGRSAAVSKTSRSTSEFTQTTFDGRDSSFVPCCDWSFGHSRAPQVIADGVPEFSPRLARSGYLGKGSWKIHNLNEVVANAVTSGRNHVVVEV